jgi:Zn finger protein HypA/HybF involved in hydrogenase expression
MLGLRGEIKMPTVRKSIEVNDDLVDVAINFEIWCANCGTGICGNTEYRRGSENHFDTRCDQCNKEREEIEKGRDIFKERMYALQIEIKERDDEIDSLNKRIEELEEELANG